MITSDSHVFHLNYMLLKAEKGRIQRTEVNDVLQQGVNIDDEIITRRSTSFTSNWRSSVPNK